MPPQYLYTELQYTKLLNYTLITEYSIIIDLY